MSDAEVRPEYRLSWVTYRQVPLPLRWWERVLRRPVRLRPEIQTCSRYVRSGDMVDFENVRDIGAFLAGVRSAVVGTVTMLQLERMPAPTAYIPTPGLAIEAARTNLALRSEG